MRIHNAASGGPIPRHEPMKRRLSKKEIQEILRLKDMI